MLGFGRRARGHLFSTNLEVKLAFTRARFSAVSVEQLSLAVDADIL